MSKSIYSLVLNDQLVSMLDKVAYKKGMSRSNLINTIIADYLSYETPEKRIAYVFKHVENLVAESQSLKFMPQPSASLASICSAISFRYNPTVRYSIELFSNTDEEVGELKVYLRSTNVQLLMALNNFFVIFCGLEEKYLSKADSKIVEGKFIRPLSLPQNVTLNNTEMGDAIVDYIKNMDKLLNLYFSQLNAGDIDYAYLEKEYVRGLKKQSVIFV